ncbi:MAG: hypothetical protein J6O49_16880 [Bacteroidaceae bacterium]|nr:hypothetical protein [Bacteroidaceae bacterium]
MLISEKEYLDKLKALIDKFFKDRAEYAEKYMDEMKDYMSSVMSYYNSVISGVTTLLDHRISQIQDQKDSTITSLEEERDAVQERYQAEIDAIDEAIKAKEKEIDAIQDQIQAIEDANAARDRSIQLQKAEYALQQAMHHRTRLVYTGEVGQMRYERDESGLRDARENLNDAQDEIAIAKLQEQIDLIQDTIDALNEQKEAIQTAMEESSKYYEKLIKEQEKMFDEMIKKLEDTKKKWEELAAIEELSKSWGLVSEAMAEYGYTVEDVLNDTPGAFEAFKSEYLRILNEMHSGDKGFLEGVKQFGGEVPGEFQKVASSATEAETPIKKLGDSAGTATGKVSSFGTTASTAATGVGELKDKSEGIADNLNELNDVQLSGVIDGPLATLEEKLTTLKDLISGPDSLLTAFNNLNTTVDIQGIVDAFGSLDEAIKGAVSSIGGGGSDEEGTYGGAGKHGKNSMPSNIPTSGVDGGTGGGLVGAINSVKAATDAAIGTSAEEEGETATGAFFALKTAVDNVTSAIGMGEEGGAGGIKGMLQNAGSEGGGGEGTLTAAITSIKPTTEAALTGEDGAIAAFEEFKAVLAELVGLANELLTTLQQLSSIELPQIHGGSHGFFRFTGSAIGGQHYEGTAKLNGDWSVRQGGTSLVGELGQELVVDSKSGKFRTVGDRGPEFVRLNPGDIVFNHLQTEELLSKKNLVLPKKGRSFANGTLPEGFFPWSDSSALNSLKAKIAEVGLPTIDGIKTALQAQTEAIRSEVRNAVSNNSSAETTVNQHNTFNISGVSGEDVARQINTTLVNTFSGMSLNAYQRSMA